MINSEITRLMPKIYCFVLFSEKSEIHPGSSEHFILSSEHVLESPKDFDILN